MKVCTLLLLGALFACTPDAQTPYVYDLPPGLNPPSAPLENPTTIEKAALGKLLFEEPLLSQNGAVSCATCHRLDRAFSEDKALSEGVGQRHSKNAPTLFNVGYASSMGWANPAIRTLERHVPVPLFGEEPVEMGATSETIEAVAQKYRTEIDEAFEEEGTDLQKIIFALSAYQRTLIALEDSALSEEELRGQRLFHDERLQCASCHVPPFYTDAIKGQDDDPRKGFHNNGNGAEGLFSFTGQQSDRGHFKTPTLRKVSLTSPYFHDGSLQTLEEVIDHYARGGDASALGRDEQDPRTMGFLLEEDEKEALVAFLRTL